MMDLNKLKQEVNRIKWFHRIDLGNGIITPGINNSSSKRQTLNLPENLQGKTVLDIGAWDGFFSFECERRGAKRVLATDSFSWNSLNWGTKAGFELARKALNSKVEDMDIDVLELSPEKTGTFDLVLFLGVLYHMRDPLLALEKVFSVTKKMLILETHADMLWCKRPAAAFYPDDELNNDPTNWWGPNPSAIMSMLKSVGFKKIKMVHKTPMYHRVASTFYRTFKRNAPFFSTLQQCRIVVHAWR